MSKLADTREEWIERCTQRFLDKTDLDRETAGQFAETAFESINEDLTEEPEYIADEEMSCWGE